MSHLAKVPVMGVQSPDLLEAQIPTLFFLVGCPVFSFFHLEPAVSTCLPEKQAPSVRLQLSHCPQRLRLCVELDSLFKVTHQQGSRCKELGEKETGPVTPSLGSKEL